MGRTLIIAEAGVNHNGSLKIAKELVRSASDAGTDFVKFQTFRAIEIASKFAPKADYQIETTGSDEGQIGMLKKLELSLQDHRELMTECDKFGISFLSAPFDLDSIELLNELRLETLKIPSGEITNLPYLRRIGRLGRKLILSTGMSVLDEISDALDILVKAGTPKDNITVLHCVTEYPAPAEDANLRAMLTIRDSLGVRVGYSDHTLGIDVALASAALGAEVIEKHFTLDKGMEGPDHRSSLDPGEFRQMVRGIRDIESALGDGIKRPAPSELPNIRMVRKSIVAATHIKKGDVFSEENLKVKRPATGLSPMLWDQVLGKPARRDFEEDEVIEI